MKEVHLISLFIILFLPYPTLAQDAINPDVQLQENGWLKIVDKYVQELRPEEYYKENYKPDLHKKNIRRLIVKLQFLQPCAATTKKQFDFSKEFDEPPLSPEAQAYFLLLLSGKAKKDSPSESERLYEEYKTYCGKIGVDPIEFLMDVSILRFKCDYRTKVFVTFFSKNGQEIETEGMHPIANFEKTEMVPGEMLLLPFLIPEEAVSWYPWVPK